MSMNTINLSQFDMVSSTNLDSYSPVVLDKLTINQNSTNILKLNGVNVVMDKLATKALYNLKEKYKVNTLIIKKP
jgi:hypothetical protein